MYAGVDYIAGTAQFGLYSDDCSGNTYFNQKNLGSTNANEALGINATLYLGGSLNYYTTTLSNYHCLAGSLYRSMFLVNYYTTLSQNAKSLMLGELGSMFNFGLDITGTSQLLQDPTNFANYFIRGTDLKINTNDPTLNGLNGYGFLDANLATSTLYLSYNLDYYNFISLWVKVLDNTPASAYHTIFSVLTPSGSEFVSLVFQKASNQLVVRGAGTAAGTPATITLNSWHFVFMTFNIRIIQSLIMVNLIVDST